MNWSTGNADKVSFFSAAPVFAFVALKKNCCTYIFSWKKYLKIIRKAFVCLINTDNVLIVGNRIFFELTPVLVVFRMVDWAARSSWWQCTSVKWAWRGSRCQPSCPSGSSRPASGQGVHSIHSYSMKDNQEGRAASNPCLLVYLKGSSSWTR